MNKSNKIVHNNVAGRQQQRPTWQKQQQRQRRRQRRRRRPNGFAEALPIFAEGEVLTRFSAGVFLILEINSDITVKKSKIGATFGDFDSKKNINSDLSIVFP